MFYNARSRVAAPAGASNAGGVGPSVTPVGSSNNNSVFGFKPCAATTAAFAGGAAPLMKAPPGTSSTTTTGVGSSSSSNNSSSTISTEASTLGNMSRTKGRVAAAAAPGIAPPSSRVPVNASTNWNWRDKLQAKAADKMDDEVVSNLNHDDDNSGGTTAAAAACFTENQNNNKAMMQQQQQQQQQEEQRVDGEEPALAGYRIEDDEYIRTPGNHLVRLNEFWMDVDSNYDCKLIPQIGDFSVYAQDIYQSWRQQELKLGDEIRYCYAADSSPEFERYRIYSVVWVYRTTVSLEFSPQICHYAVFSLNRAFRKLKECGYKISLPLFFGILSASLRVAVKHDESFDRQYRVKYDARTAFSVNRDLEVRVGLDKINEIENRLVGFLGSPMLPPSSLDFLERFVRVGQWPDEVTKEARALARYCLDLALFANRGVLERMGICAPSLIAAAALALAIKVVGATTGSKYEPWPKRLELYTGYRMTQLSHHLSGLCHLLRNKPDQAGVLEKVHPYWGKQTWQ